MSHSQMKARRWRKNSEEQVLARSAAYVNSRFANDDDEWEDCIPAVEKAAPLAHRDKANKRHEGA